MFNIYNRICNTHTNVNSPPLLIIIFLTEYKSEKKDVLQKKNKQ